MADSKYALAPTEPPPSYETAAHSPNHAGAPAKPVLRAPLPLNLPALNSLRGKRVILASASPRRKQLLAQIGLTNIETIPSPLPENLPKTLSPFEYVLQTATRKALAVYSAEINNPHLGEPALLIAADTVVVSSAGELLEKPRSEAHHVAMLRTLRDTGEHRVFTAVVVMAPLASAREPGYALETAVEETRVVFDARASDELVLAYVRTREGVDKAGGYGVQGGGAVLVEGVFGSFDNVVGLPVRVTLGLVEKVLGRVGEEEVEDEFAEGEEGEEEEG